MISRSAFTRPELEAAEDVLRSNASAKVPVDPRRPVAAPAPEKGKETVVQTVAASHLIAAVDVSAGTVRELGGARYVMNPDTPARPVGGFVGSRSMPGLARMEHNR